MKIVVYGLSVTSSWGNGHATTYRSLLRALSRKGHSVVFVEKDVQWYRDARDMPSPDFCTVVLYQDWFAEESHLVSLAHDADAVIVGSYFPDAIAASLALFQRVDCPVFFYDIDTPVTLAGLRAHGGMPYLDAHAIPHYAAYLSFSGGLVLLELRERFGAQRSEPLYCSVDPDLYRRTAVQEKFACDLSYLGTYSEDRQSKLMTFLIDPAAALPDRSFLVAGPQYPPDVKWSPNVTRFDHVAPSDHAALYSSSRFVLNLTRADMVAAGYSPSVRLFEASACASTILSDSWAGLEDFLTPGSEILLPANAQELTLLLRDLNDDERVRIGERARDRILSEHTSAIRAQQFEDIVASCN